MMIASVSFVNSTFVLGHENNGTSILIDTIPLQNIVWKRRFTATIDCFVFGHAVNPSVITYERQVMNHNIWLFSTAMGNTRIQSFKLYWKRDKYWRREIIIYHNSSHSASHDDVWPRGMSPLDHDLSLTWRTIGWRQVGHIGCIFNLRTFFSVFVGLVRIVGCTSKVCSRGLLNEDDDDDALSQQSYMQNAHVDGTYIC